MRKIIYPEYRRRVFNHCLLECLSRINESCCCDSKTEHETREMANSLAKKFYANMLNLENSTITTTKKNLSEAVTFIQDCLNISETIAACKEKEAKEEKLEILEDQEIELSKEDEVLLDKVFEEKHPEVQIDAVRDATVNALLAEDRKAQEIKDSITIAQAQATSNNDPKVMEETVSRLSGRGPTSLMNAIMNAVSTDAVKVVNETSDHPVSVGDVMKENADIIKTRATVIYSLYEAANVFGIKKFTPADIKRIASDIYYKG